MEPRRAAAALDDLKALHALGNPVRRRLYEFVSDAGRAVGREAAAAAAGVSRSLAAYHLDRLVEQGLLEPSFEHQGGRSGPVAGRPMKLYKRAQREFVLRVPPRDYRLLSELLVRAAASDAGGVVTATLERVSHDVGRELAATAKGEEADADLDALTTVLRRGGYEPFEDESGTVRLRNCPFEAVASRYPDVVCRLNLGLVEGILDGLDTGEARAVLEPGEGVCCVAIRTATNGPMRA